MDIIKQLTRLTAVQERFSQHTNFRSAICCARKSDNKNDNNPSGYYVYEITKNQHKTLGLIAAVPLHYYLNKRILKHEDTEPEKTHTIINQFQEDSFQRTPVLITFRDTENIQSILKRHTELNQPIADIHSDDTNHKLWYVSHKTSCDNLAQLFNRIQQFYIADGHHRFSGAERLKKSHLLAFLVNHEQLFIQSFSKIVLEWRSSMWTKENLLKFIGIKFEILPCKTSHHLSNNKSCMMLLEKNPYLLVHKHDQFFYTPALASTEVHNWIFKTGLNISSENYAKRVLSIPQQHTLEHSIQKSLTQDTDRLSFFFNPIPIETIFQLSGYYIKLPPNVTWFEPKALSNFIFFLLEAWD